jgi:1-acyl-sn-glycerol-3-phosphate acyltransferase
VRLVRSLLYTTWLFLGTGVYACIVLLIFWAPTRWLYALADHWARGQLWMLKALCGLTYTIEGRENIPEGAHVSMWKHSSTWETIAQAAIFPPQAWVLKRELIWIPLVGWAIWLLKPIAINRNAGATAVNQVIEQGTQRLAAGYWILIFPEGTRVAVGESRKYGVSGALLASKAGCKIIPVAHNAGKFWPRRGWVKHPGTIQVAIGPPIEAAGRDPRELNAEIRGWIDGKLTTLGAPEPRSDRPSTEAFPINET